MLLNELFESDTKHITFVFGRLNPPTRGHEQLLNTAAEQGGDYKIFVSQSQDKKKNPLDYATKIKFIREMFPKHADHVVEDSSLNTIMKIASYLYDQGYNAVTFVAGSDRLEEMKKLLEAYNGVEGKAHGFYDFQLLDFVSSGEREDGAEGVAGISASGARAAAAEGNLEAFKEATGAGELSKPLYDAVRKGMGINESVEESLDEAISPEEAIRSIVSTADSITTVYGDLKTMAEKWVYNNGTLKGFHRNAAGVGKRWYDKFFWNNMDNDLRLLMAKNPKAADKIRDFFNIERDDKGHVSFTTIGRSLPRILNHVGEQMNNKDLKRFAAEWFRKHKDYEDFLGRVEAEVNDEDDDFAPTPKQPKDNVVGRQNAAAEDIVNQILRSIDKKVAGEIRNAIAREPNKLQALQRELAKRNIKVGESMYRMKSKGVLEGSYTTEKQILTRIRQIMHDRKLSGTESNAGELHRLKQQLKDMRSQQGVSEGDLDEDWRKKLAALGMAGMMGVSGAAGAADTAKTEPIIATIVIDGEAKRLDLTPKGFTDVRDAEKWIAKFMRERGIVDWQGKIERGEPGSGKYQRVRIMGAGGLESIQEAPIEMDPADPMDPMIYGHDQANPGKLKYRMSRAARQLKDLAARIDGATPEEWKKMTQQFDELKMNMEQIRHALEELGKIRKKGGIRSRGITV